MEQELDQSVVLLKGRLEGGQKNRLAKLLDMLYKPSELADEIGFSLRQIYRVYMPAGCPHTKDGDGNVWINGKLFREWIREVYQKRQVGLDEAFCLTCKRAVKMVEPERFQEGRLFYYLCKCPECGRKLARIITRGKVLNDQP